MDHYDYLDNTPKVIITSYNKIPHTSSSLSIGVGIT